MSSPSDYDTAPDMMEPVETCPAVPRSEGRDKIFVLSSQFYLPIFYIVLINIRKMIINTVTGK